MGITDSMQVKYETKQAVIQAQNLALGRQANGEAQKQEMFSTMDYGLMAGVGGMAAIPQRRQLVNPKFQWYNANGQLADVSRGVYLKNNAASHMRSWTNFNHMDFVNTKVQALEGYISSNAAHPVEQAFKNVNVTQLSSAKNSAEFKQIVRNNPNDYKTLKNILKRQNPKALTQLFNSVRYKQTYGKVLEEFKAAQKSMRMTGTLPQGQTFDALSKNLADARLNESNLIKQGAKGKGIQKGWLKRTGASSSRMVKQAMAASKTLRTVSRHASKAGGAVAAALTLVSLGVEVSTAAACAKDGEGTKDAMRQLGKSSARAACELGGAFAGAKLGAMVGGCLGPVGAVVGGLIGGIAGWAIGSWGASKSEYMNTSVVEEHQIEENEKLMNAVNTAIENDDIETLAQHAMEFYEYEVDENGQVKLDENGQPQLIYMTDANGDPLLDENGEKRPKIRTVSDNEEIQKQFETAAQKTIEYVQEKYAELAAMEAKTPSGAEAQLVDENEEYLEDFDILGLEDELQEPQISRRVSVSSNEQLDKQEDQQEDEQEEQDVVQEVGKQPTYYQPAPSFSYNPSAFQGTLGGYDYPQQGSSYAAYNDTQYNGSYVGAGNYATRSYVPTSSAFTNTGYTPSWTNKAWQDGLAEKYNNTNFYNFDASKFSPLALYQQANRWSAAA